MKLPWPPQRGLAWCGRRRGRRCGRRHRRRRGRRRGWRLSRGLRAPEVNEEGRAARMTHQSFSLHHDHDLKTKHRGQGAGPLFTFHPTYVTSRNLCLHGNRGKNTMETSNENYDSFIVLPSVPFLVASWSPPLFQCLFHTAWPEAARRPALGPLDATASHAHPARPLLVGPRVPAHAPEERNEGAELSEENGGRGRIHPFSWTRCGPLQGAIRLGSMSLPKS